MRTGLNLEETAECPLRYANCGKVDRSLSMFRAFVHNGATMGSHQNMTFRRLFGEDRWCIDNGVDFRSKLPVVFILYVRSPKLSKAPLPQTTEWRSE